MCLHGVVIDEVFSAMQAIKLGKAGLLKVDTLVQKLIGLRLQIIVNLLGKNMGGHGVITHFRYIQTSGLLVLKTAIVSTTISTYLIEIPMATPCSPTTL